MQDDLVPGRPIAVETRSVVQSRQTLKCLAREFLRLSGRFDRFVSLSEKVRHLAENVHQCAVQAGRLLVSAIDAGAFPGSARERNGDWWDRRIGRVPGGPFAIPGTFQWKLGDPLPHQAPAYLVAAAGAFDAQQFSAVWMFAVGSWLVRDFPDRFRDKARSYDWSQILTDKAGYPIGKNGKRLEPRWYKNGKLLPKSFEYAFQKDGANYSGRLNGRLVLREELYDEADWLAHLRIRAEVYSDACRVLAELIDPDEVASSHLTSIPIQYVTRSQFAAIVSRSPRTFERIKDLPPPAIAGGMGKPSEWIWSDIKPWLERKFGRNLPDQFPGDKFIRQ